MSYISIYGTLTTLKSIEHSIRLLLPLIYASCLPYKTPAVVSRHICTPLSTIPLFNSGSIPMEPFTMFVGDVSYVFREKKKSEWKYRK